MVKSEKFSKLSLTSKSSFLWESGKWVMDGEEGEDIFKLYILRDFFVEVGFSKSKMMVDGINVIDHSCQLDKYLPLIDLPKNF